MHVRAAPHNGLTVDEIKELILQTAIYCGVPDANTAFRIAQRRAGRDGDRDPRRSPMTAAFLYAAVRTPFGRFGGALAESPPRRPGRRPRSTACSAEAPDLDPAAIDEVVLGQRQRRRRGQPQRRPDGRRCSPGCRCRCPRTTVNRLCGSQPRRRDDRPRGPIETGDADVVLAGGVESMTRAPWVLPKPARAFPAGDVTAVSTTLGWRLVNPQMPAEWTVSLGEANEQLQERFGISPRAAGRVRRPLAPARRRGLGRRASTTTSWCRSPGADLARDESIRAGTTAETLAGLKPVVPARTARSPPATPPRSTTAPPRVLLGSEAAAARIGADPIARIAGRGASALEPQVFGYAPVEAANTALARAGIGWADVGAVELNEAFAVQSLACVDAWERRPRDRQHPAAARSRSATRSAPPAAGSSAPWPRCSASAATAGAWPRSASASARAWPSCSRTSHDGSRPMTDDRVADDADEAVAGIAGRRDRADRRLRHGRPCRSS